MTFFYSFISSKTRQFLSPLTSGEFPCWRRFASVKMSITRVANSWALNLASFCRPCITNMWWYYCSLYDHIGIKSKKQVRPLFWLARKCWFVFNNSIADSCLGNRTLMSVCSVLWRFYSHFLKADVYLTFTKGVRSVIVRCFGTARKFSVMGKSLGQNSLHALSVFMATS